MRPLTTLAAFALLLGTGGCAVTYDATHLGVPISLADAPPGAPATAGTPFSVTKHPVHVMWGLFTAGEPNLDDVLAGQLGPGTGLAQVRIRSRLKLTDLVFTAITFGFLSPRSVTFDGVIVGAGTSAPAVPPTTH